MAVEKWFEFDQGIASGYSLIDADSREKPTVFDASAHTFNFAFFNFNTLKVFATASLTSIRIDLRESAAENAASIWSKTVAAAAVNGTISLSNWLAKTDYHAQTTASLEDMDYSLDANATAELWLTATAIWDDDSEEVLGGGFVTMIARGEQSETSAFMRKSDYDSNEDGLIDNAVYTNVSNQFPTITQKATPVAADVLLLEDSEDSFKKKRVLFSALSNDANAIHKNVAGEIAAITAKATPVAADMLLIEDSADSNNKKRIAFSALSDANAIHKNAAGEIAAITAKATPVAADMLLIEDSADSNNKKRIAFSALSNDANAIHNNVAGEIAAVAAKATPVGADMLLIEDSADSNNKKRIAVSSLPSSGGSDGFVFLDGVTGATGGGGTNLDGVVTLSQSVPYEAAFKTSLGLLRFYQLVSGTDAENSPWVIRPDDYAASTNEKVWKLVGQEEVVPFEIFADGEDLTSGTHKVGALPTNMLLKDVQFYCPHLPSGSGATASITIADFKFAGGANQMTTSLTIDSTFHSIRNEADNALVAGASGVLGQEITVNITDPGTPIKAKGLQMYLIGLAVL